MNTPEPFCEFTGPMETPTERYNRERQETLSRLVAEGRSAHTVGTDMYLLGWDHALDAEKRIRREVLAMYAKGAANV